MSHRLISPSLSLAIGLAALALGGSPTIAADLDPGYAQIPSLQEEKVEFGSGWYVRGDLGGTHGLAISAGAEPYTGIFSGPGTAFPSLSTSQSSRLLYDGTLGAGYQFNKWFRGDVTFDFHQPTKNAYEGTSVACVTGTTPGIPNAQGVITTETYNTTSCTPSLISSLKTYSALVNGYIDLGTWSRVTPYVGAGIGMSFGHAQASATYYQNNQLAYAGITYTDSLSGATYYQNWDRSQSTQYYNLAFALMAGISIDVFDHTKLDIGYRYLNLGSVLRTNLSTQEVRAGLRYMVDN